MKSKSRKITAGLASIMLVCTITGCRKERILADASSHASVSTVTLTEGKYSEEKLEDTWDEKTAVYFSLKEDEISVEEKGLCDTAGLKDMAEITGSTVRIRKAGTYVFSGSLTDGRIIVDADQEETVRIILHGANITCTDSAPVYAKGGNVIITLADDTKNTIEDGSVYTFDENGEEEPKAAVFAKDDLTFNGTGTLQVIGNYNHGIQCKDDLKFVSGTYVIHAENDGIVGKDSVSVRNGSFTIESGDDGIKASNTEDSDKGYVMIENGSFKINALGDGIQAETLLRVNGGDFEITAGGGSQNAKSAAETAERMNGKIPEGRMEPPEGRTPEGGAEPPEGGTEPPEGKMPEERMEPSEGGPPFGGTPALEDENKAADVNNAADVNDEETDESASAKGLKSYVELVITGGEFYIDSQDDGLHSDRNLTVQGGTVSISSGDDGIHADEALTIDGGNLDIQKSYEGLEGFDITINGGDIKIVSSDDGINAAGKKIEESVSDEGGPMKNRFMEEDQGALMTVNGGVISVNAGGDGLDANGDISINGGTVTVHGPSDGGNGTLDYASSCKITGGTFIGIGSIGMAQDPSEDSTQASVVVRTDEIMDAGTDISLKDREGNILAQTKTLKDAQWAAVSLPELRVGETYILCAGTTEKEVLLTQMVTIIKY